MSSKSPAETARILAESFVQNAKAREFVVRTQDMLINNGNPVSEDVIKKAVRINPKFGLHMAMESLEFFTYA